MPSYLTSTGVGGATIQLCIHPIFTSTTEFHPSWWGCEERVSWSSTMWKHFAVMSTMKHSECQHLSVCAPSPSLRQRSSLPERLLLAQNGTNTLQLFVPSFSFVAMQFNSLAICCASLLHWFPHVVPIVSRYTEALLGFATFI